MDSTAPVSSNFTSLASLMEAHLAYQEPSFNLGSSLGIEDLDFTDLGNFEPSDIKANKSSDSLDSKNKNINEMLSDLQLTQNKENEENINEDAWEIDLTEALIKTNINKVKNDAVVPVAATSPDDSKFTPEFISCDFEPEYKKRLKKVSVLPCLFTHPEGFIFPPKRSYEKCSTMGKIICKNFKKLPVVRIKHKYHANLEKVKVFKFDIPSPDEIIIERLKKTGGRLYHNSLNNY